MWQVEGRINNQILGVKGLNYHQYYQWVIIVGYNECIVILFTLSFLWGTFFFVLMWNSSKLSWNAISSVLLDKGFPFNT